MNLKILLVIAFCFFSCHRDPYYIQQADRITGAFSEEAYRSDRLLPFGSGGAFMDDVKKINLTYIAYRKATVSEARELIVRHTERLLEKINADLKIRPYLHDYPFTALNLKFSIIFEDKKGEIQSPFLGHVMLINGDIVYSINEIKVTPWNSVLNTFKTVYEEPYSEAVRIVGG